jgi:hypothetical protein
MMPVSALTEDHVGWEIRVADPDPVIKRRIFVLGGLRTWTYNEKTTVGLVDTTDAWGPIKGTERHYAPETPCELLRQIKKPRPRRKAKAVS